MLLSLTSSSSSDSRSPSVVGGKAASLAKLCAIPQLSSHVPKSFALTVEFFEPWVKITRHESNNKQEALPLTTHQQAALDTLGKQVARFARGLAAVRSSAPEEDGSTLSFAGAFVTKLGVSTSTLEQAVRECFASRWDARVMNYVQNCRFDEATYSLKKDVSFAVVVMEMIDSQIAGVAFSANPLNSDRDELVIGHRRSLHL